MLFCEEKKFIFVAVPKTGSGAIQTRLVECDPEVRRNAAIDETGTWVEMPNHASARQIRKVMGSRAKDYTFIAFLRDPRSVILSKFHFLREGRAARLQGLTGQPRPEGVRFNLGITMRVLFAQALPLRVWSQLYPFRSSGSFVTDENGTLIVDEIGLMERLQEDVNRIFGRYGYSKADLDLPMWNRTDYDRATFDLGVLDGVAARRLSRDIALYRVAIKKSAR